MHDLAYLKELNRTETLKRAYGPDYGPSREAIFDAQVEEDAKASDAHYEATIGAGSWQNDPAYTPAEQWGPASSWPRQGDATVKPLLPAGRHNTGWSQPASKPYGVDDPIYRAGYEAGRASLQAKLDEFEGRLASIMDQVLTLTSEDNTG